MSALDTVGRFVSPQDMRSLLRTNKDYTKNRDRVGALTADGLALYDSYRKFRPYLFWGSVAGAAASAYYFQRRGRKPDNREAMVLYGASFLLCAATAWFTRPIGTTDVPDGAPPGTEPTEDGAFVRWIDSRVEKHKARDPAFADAAIGRLVSMPGIKESFQATHPLIRAAVV